MCGTLLVHFMGREFATQLTPSVHITLFCWGGGGGWGEGVHYSNIVHTFYTKSFQEELSLMTAILIQQV